MKTEKLKQSISDKELRLSQLRTMDTNKLKLEDLELIQSLEKEIKELKNKLREE